MYSPLRESASIAFDRSRHCRNRPNAAWRAEARTHFYKEVILKNKKLSIRISEDNLALIHQKAEKAKLSFTDYVTRACLGKQIVTVDGLDEILKEQKAIGRNLNQLAMHSNMGRVQAVNLAELTRQYAELNKKLTELLERKR